jgi:hypothetical protein
VGVVIVCGPDVWPAVVTKPVVVGEDGSAGFTQSGWSPSESRNVPGTAPADDFLGLEVDGTGFDEGFWPGRTDLAMPPFT